MEGAKNDRRNKNNEEGRTQEIMKEGEKVEMKAQRKGKSYSLQFRSSDISPQSLLPSQKADSRMQCFL